MLQQGQIIAHRLVVNGVYPEFLDIGAQALGEISAILLQISAVTDQGELGGIFNHPQVVYIIINISRNHKASPELLI